MKHSTGCARRRQRRLTKHAQEVDANCFFNLLTGPQLLQIVEAHLPEHRERRYPPTLTLSMFLGQVMSADSSCQNAVNTMVVNRLLSDLSPGNAHTSGYCMARQRLPLTMVRALVRESAALLEQHTPPGWLWRGRRVKQVDGTTILMPDTEENQAAFPQHGAQAPGVGFPLARLVGVTSLSHGALFDVAMAPFQGKGTGEHALFGQLKESFGDGDLMLADGYYCSYFLIADLIERGVDVLFEQHGARHTDFRCGQRLGARDHQVQWSRPARPSWMSHQEYACFPKQITVREVKVDKKVLVTTLLSPRQYPKAALGELYLQRWNVELDLRNIKTTLGMEMLSCKTPQMCEKQMWVYLLAYNLIRMLMAAAAQQAAVYPRHLSFKHTLQIWTAWSQRQFLTGSPEDTAGLLRAIAQVRVGHRPDRIEPRAVKRRPKPYPRLRVPRQIARENIRKHGHPRKLSVI